MVEIAVGQGKYDIPSAIALAKQIPTGTEAYKSSAGQSKL